MLNLQLAVEWTKTQMSHFYCESPNCYFADKLVCFPTLRSNPFYEPRSSGAVTSDVDGSISEKSIKYRAPLPPSAGPNPTVAAGSPIPKTSAPEGTPTPPALAPSAISAVIGRELASSSPKVNLPHHIMTLISNRVWCYCVMLTIIAVIRIKNKIYYNS